MRIVSGIQPSSDALHIGNYFGAVRQWLDLQNNEDCFFFIADLHALTEPTNSDEFKRRVLSIAQDYLALGLDKSTLFLQSAVPQHTQLMWLLTTVTAMGDLERMMSMFAWEVTLLPHHKRSWNDSKRCSQNIMRQVTKT